jgi:hypothetical protein
MPQSVRRRRRRLLRLLLNAATAVLLGLALAAITFRNTPPVWFTGHEKSCFGRMLAGRLVVGWGPSDPALALTFRFLSVPSRYVCLALIAPVLLRVIFEYARRLARRRRSRPGLCPA